MTTPDEDAPATAEPASPTDGDPTAGDSRERIDLLFDCCHPALPAAARVALVLRLVAGLSVAEVADAFDVPEPTMGHRLEQAGRRLAEQLTHPQDGGVTTRLHCTREVIHLAFNEGQRAAARSGQQPGRDIAAVAIDLGRLALQEFPDDAELSGLLAFMLFVHARRDARDDVDGSLMAFHLQDRTRWHDTEIAEARFHLRRSRQRTTPGAEGPLHLRAVIQSLQTEPADVAAVPWPKILTTYDRLMQIDHSEVVALHRATALAEVEGPAAALAAVEALDSDSHLAHAVRADLLRRLDRHEDAARAWQDAVDRSRGPAHRPTEGDPSDP